MITKLICGHDPHQCVPDGEKNCVVGQYVLCLVCDGARLVTGEADRNPDGR